MLHRLWLTAALLAGAITAPAQTPKNLLRPQPELHGGDTRTQSLDQGFIDRYPVQMQAGQYLHITLEQGGTPTIVQIADPDGKILIKRENPFQFGGDVTASAVAETTGTYSVYVVGELFSSHPATYKLHVDPFVAPPPFAVDQLAAEQATSTGLHAIATGKAQQPLERAAELWHKLGDPGQEART